MKYKIPTYKVRLVRERPTIKCVNTDEAAAILTDLCTRDDQSREVMWCLHVDGCNNIIGGECVGKGGKHGLAITPSDILRGAIVSGASAIVLGHNHPCGNPTPSHEDIHMTRALKEAGEAVGISLLDHIVVTAYDGHHCIKTN